MKQEKNFAWMMVIAMACMMMTACSLDSYEPEEPSVTSNCSLLRKT